MVNNAESREAHMEPLTAQDRCDRCGARAVARTRHPRLHRKQTSDILLWCAHHYNRFAGPLAEHLVYWQEHDEDEQREPARA